MSTLRDVKPYRTSRRAFLKMSFASALFPFLPRVRLQGPERVWRETGVRIESLASFDKTMQQFMQERNIPGGSLAVTRAGRLMLARGYNWSLPSSDPINPTSLFRIASLSKPFTSAALMTLVQDKKLSLSRKLVEVLDFKPALGASRDEKLKDVSLLNLLQHQGGWDSIATFDPMFYDEVIARFFHRSLPISTRDILHYMSGQPLQFTPGTKYVYSNFGYCLLGRIIEAVSGQPYGQYVTERVMTPLGIKHMRLGRSLPEQRLQDEVEYFTSDTRRYPSVFDSNRSVLSPYGAFNLENMDAHGGWVASAVDLVRFAASFDNPARNPILDAHAIENTFAVPPTGMEQGGWYYASGWAVRPAGSRRNTWHAGSLPGTFTFLVRRFDGLDWAVLFNQRDDPSGKDYNAIDGLLHRAADAVSEWPEHDLFEQY